MKWKGLIPGLAVCFALSGCLTTNELINTGVTTSTATVASVAGASVPVVALTTAAAGTIAGVVTPEPVTVDKAITALPPEQQAEVLKHQKVWTAVEHIGIWVLGILALLWFLPSPQEIFMKMRKKKDV
ncbi:MAG: hypothetical protein MPJ08_09085 [Nitrosopumilus sp.]|nr:hypothetical protein [Nitrosopumilus sp.]